MPQMECGMGRKANDFAGKVFGELTVKRQGESTPKESTWVCDCSCGNIVTVTSGALRRGQKRCSNCSNPNFVDHTGERFGRLVARKFLPGKPKPKWECICDCGNVSLVPASVLVRGDSQSCGCLAIEVRRLATRTHGLTGHTIHDTWTNIRQRCENPNNTGYDRYGARGIKVCERWQSFDAFVEDMLPTWKEGYSIERLDVNGNYEPDNCIWATAKEQARNRETTMRFEVNGEVLTVPELAEKYSIRQNALWRRVRKGETGDELVRPVRK